MANVKITALNSLAAADAAAGDVFVIDDISQSESKKLTVANLKTIALEAGTTASRALKTDGSGNIVVSDVTSAELDHLDGVTSAIQTQFTAAETRRTNNIAGAISTVTTSDLTASRALVTNGDGKIAVSDVTSAEIDHLDGVSSAIQTQLDAKIATTASASNDYVTFTRLNANVNVVQDNVAAIPSSFANSRYVTTTANSYNIGVTVASINEIDVYVGGAYQSKKEYVLANSRHNVQFTDATFVAGEDIEIISRT